MERLDFLMIAMDGIKKEWAQYLADIATRGAFGGGVVQSEARVFACELVGMVDGTVTAMAKSSFISRTE